MSSQAVGVCDGSDISGRCVRCLKSASVICMVELRWHDSFAESALHSVEDLAKVEQIVKPSDSIRCFTVVGGGASLAALCFPVRPRRRNVRAAAVR